jgi:hypothetical protein
MPFYKGSSYSIWHIIFCALASIADAIMVLLLYIGFAFIFRNTLWIQYIKWPQAIIVMITGGAGAVVSEIWHLSSGNWTYSDLMPIIPVVNVGLIPVLQFIILPLLIYFLSFYFLKNNQQKRHFMQ